MTNKKVAVRIWSICLVSMAVAGILVVFFAAHNSHNGSAAPLLSAQTPWASVGGCGAGGSGGGSADGIKWNGQGVTGGLLDIEFMTKYNFGQSYKTLTFQPRFSTKPSRFLPFFGYSTSLGLTTPISSKSGQVQYRTNQTANDRTTGGLGDISIDMSRSVGMSNIVSINMSVSIPTGQYDIKRGPDAAPVFLPSSLQKGGGLWSASFGFSLSKDIEDGMLMTDFTFGYPFNMKLVTGQNEFLGDADGVKEGEKEYFDNPAYANAKDNERFYYRFKPYGESDLGSFAPPSVSGSFAYVYRGVETFTHSWTFAYGFPLGVAWINSEKVDQYDPRPDPDHKVWSTAFAYGLEFVRPKYPVYLSVSIPIHDKANSADPTDEYNEEPFKTWDAPDMKDFLSQFTFAIGFKSTMF